MPWLWCSTFLKNTGTVIPTRPLNNSIPATDFTAFFGQNQLKQYWNCGAWVSNKTQVWLHSLMVISSDMAFMAGKTSDTHKHKALTDNYQCMQHCNEKMQSLEIVTNDQW